MAVFYNFLFQVGGSGESWSVLELKATVIKPLQKERGRKYQVVQKKFV